MALPAAKKPKLGDAGINPSGLDETEYDAAPDNGTVKVREIIDFDTQDTTLNVMRSSVGNILVPFAEGGLQFFMSGARANTGLKGGRYMYEVRILESAIYTEDQAGAKIKYPSNFLSLGFSTSNSGLFLGKSEDNVCFDTEGYFAQNGTKAKVSKVIDSSGVTLAVVLNLDPSSTNALTLSLFVDGVRMCTPQRLPEHLVGKSLYPAVMFKNLSLQYNFGPVPLQSLSFKCRMVQEAAWKHVERRMTREVSKPEIIFPLLLPDEGSFDWLDLFLEQHPGYAELSDRALLRWAEASGIERKGGYETKISNDKPGMNFGIPEIDDGSAYKALLSMASTQKRCYVVMSMQTNLLKRERVSLLQRWQGLGFKIACRVMMGEPPQALREMAFKQMLQDKQAKSDVEFKKQAQEKKLQRDFDRKKKHLERHRSRQLKKQKQAAELARKKLEVDRKKREATAKGQKYVEPFALTAAGEEKEDEIESDDDKMEVENETPPKVELSREERAARFRKLSHPDLTDYALTTSYTMFSLPDRDEGFDEISFPWLSETPCRTYLRDWIQARKTVTRIEDITPGKWFIEKQKEWQKCLKAWHSKVIVSRLTSQKRASDQVAKLSMQTAAAAKGSNAKALTDDAKGNENGRDEDEQMCEIENESFTEVDDVYGVEDVCNVKGGKPLFSNFSFEDWALMHLRVDVHLLCHAFQRDVDEMDRGIIHLDHFPHYYQKYFKKAFNYKAYGASSVESALQYARDAVTIGKKSKVLEPLVPENLESFAIFPMLTEEARRDRLRRLQTGDAAAEVKVLSAGFPGVAPSGLSKSAFQSTPANRVIEPTKIISPISTSSQARSVGKILPIKPSSFVK